MMLTARQLLIEARKTIKNECPKITQTDREIWVNVGMNQALEVLERIIQEAEEEGLNGSILTQKI